MFRTFVAIAPRSFFVVLAGQNGAVSVETLAECDVDFIEIHVEHFASVTSRGVEDLQEIKTKVLQIMDESQRVVVKILRQHLQAVFSVADALLTDGEINTKRVRLIVEPLRQSTIFL